MRKTLTLALLLAISCLTTFPLTGCTQSPEPVPPPSAPFTFLPSDPVPAKQAQKEPQKQKPIPQKSAEKGGKKPPDTKLSKHPDAGTDTDDADE